MDKKQESYEESLEAMGFGNSPDNDSPSKFKVMLTDFEKGLRNACVEENLTDKENLKGCLFHFGQRQKKKIEVFC